MKKLTHYLFVFIFLLGNSFILAQTNGMDSSDTLKTNETYPEIFYEMNVDGKLEKIWLIWPDGKKEEIFQSVYVDEKENIEDDRFYIILTNNVEQTVVIKDKEQLERHRKARELSKKVHEQYKIWLKAQQRKRLIWSGIIVGVLLIAPLGIWYFRTRKKDPQKQ